MEFLCWFQLVDPGYFDVRECNTTQLLYIGIISKYKDRYMNQSILMECHKGFWRLLLFSHWLQMLCPEALPKAEAKGAGGKPY